MQEMTRELLEEKIRHHNLIEISRPKKVKIETNDTLDLYFTGKNRS
jgi:hypothetical protein